MSFSRNIRNVIRATGGSRWGCMYTNKHTLTRSVKIYAFEDDNKNDEIIDAVHHAAKFAGVPVKVRRLKLNGYGFASVADSLIFSYPIEM